MTIHRADSETNLLPDDLCAAVIETNANEHGSIRVSFSSGEGRSVGEALVHVNAVSGLLERLTGGNRWNGLFESSKRFSGTRSICNTCGIW